jgi:hypothetical protein
LLRALLLQAFYSVRSEKLLMEQLQYNRRSAIDGRTTRHPGYPVSGRLRKRIEEVFGWTKAAAGFRKTRHRGLARVGWMFTLMATAYNLIRLPKLVRDAV